MKNIPNGHWSNDILVREGRGWYLIESDFLGTYLDIPPYDVMWSLDGSDILGNLTLPEEFYT